MITIEEAKVIADVYLENISECKEMADAYIFSNPRTRKKSERLNMSRNTILFVVDYNRLN